MSVEIDKSVHKTADIQQKDKEMETLHFYELILDGEPDNYRALLNAAFIHLRLGWLYSGKEEKKQHYLKLLRYAERALLVRPEANQAKLLFVVARGKTAGYFPLKEQVQIVWEMKQQLEELMLTMHDDPNLLYVLSWLNYKVGRVSALQNFFASIFIGALPDDLTVEKAVKCMQQAIKLRPDYLIYYYDLGLFYQRLGQLNLAKTLFEKVLFMPVKEPEESVYQKKAVKKLLEISGEKVAERESKPFEYYDNSHRLY